jgi:hypothetical protein
VTVTFVNSSIDAVVIRFGRHITSRTSDDVDTLCQRYSADEVRLDYADTETIDPDALRALFASGAFGGDGKRVHYNLSTQQVAILHVFKLLVRSLRRYGDPRCVTVRSTEPERRSGWSRFRTESVRLLRMALHSSRRSQPRARQNILDA